MFLGSYDPMNSYKWPDKRGNMSSVESDGQLYSCEFCGEAYRSKVGPFTMHTRPAPCSLHFCFGIEHKLTLSLLYFSPQALLNRHIRINAAQDANSG